MPVLALPIAFYTIYKLLDFEDNHCLSDYELGQICGLSHATVGRLRKRHPLASTCGSDGVRLVRNKYGTRTKMRTAAIGRVRRDRRSADAASSSSSTRPLGEADRDDLQNVGGLSSLHAAVNEQAACSSALGLKPEVKASTFPLLQKPSMMLVGPSEPKEGLRFLEQFEQTSQADPRWFAHELAASKGPEIKDRLERIVEWLWAVIEALEAEQAMDAPHDRGEADDAE